MMNTINLYPFQEHKMIILEVYYPQKRWLEVKRLLMKPPMIYALIKDHFPYSISIGSDLENPEKTLIRYKFKLFLIDDDNTSVVSRIEVTYDFKSWSCFLYPSNIIFSE